VVGVGTAAGVFLALGMTPLATAPAAHADPTDDAIDMIIGPVMDGVAAGSAAVGAVDISDPVMGAVDFSDLADPGIGAGALSSVADGTFIGENLNNMLVPRRASWPLNRHGRC